MKCGTRAAAPKEALSRKRKNSLKGGTKRGIVSGAMKIAKNTVVAFDYTLTNKDGEVLDTSDGRVPLEYLHGAGNIISGLEKEMEGLGVGDKKRVEVAPEEGYGVVDPSLIIEVPRSAVEFAGTIEPGMRFHAQDGQGGVHAFTVAGVTGEKIRLDGNHPLAGVTLFFDVEVKGVRAATEHEISAGRAGASGCSSSCGGDCGGCCGDDDDEDGGCSCGCCDCDRR